MRKLIILLFLMVSSLYPSGGNYTIRIKFVSKGPELDGVIDSVWNTADSISGYLQFSPDYGKPSKYRTVVKLIQDRDNIYILGIGYTGNNPPEVNLSGESDELHFYFDPFSAGQEAYYFEVKASGEHYDAIVSDNGARWNYSWDSYWFSKVRVYPHKYVVEIKIPFRSIRYPEGVSTWRFQASRYIPRFNEMSYWVLPPRNKEHDFQSFGKIAGIVPHGMGHGMEFYPVGVIRHDQYLSDTSTSIRFGLDFSWNILSNLMLNVTYKPDFAQIEADPFGLNLSKYERYLEERRPFFIEAREVFKPHRSEFNQVYSPFTIFYSRRIGRKLPDGSEVPINIGTKLTFKTQAYQFGLISILTGEKSYMLGDSNAIEPAFLWNVLRFKIMGSSYSTGVLVSTKTRSGEYTAANYDLDGKLVFGNNQIYYQLVGSSITGLKSGVGFQSAYFYLNSSYFLGFKFRHIGRSLILDSTGYLAADPGSDVSFAGLKMVYFENKSVVSTFYGFFSSYKKLMDESKPSYSLSYYQNIRLRNGLYFELFGGVGGVTEFNRTERTYNIHFSFHRGGGSRFKLGIWVNGEKNWNYSKGIFAWTGFGGLWSEVSVTRLIQTGLNMDYWIEFDEDNELMDIYTVLRPRIEYNFTPDMTVSLNSELVFYRETRWNFNEFRIGIRYFYQFRPKSKIYLVANQNLVKSGDRFKTVERVYALKFRWAIPY